MNHTNGGNGGLEAFSSDVAGTDWKDLDRDIRSQLLDLLLDTFANAAEAASMSPYPGFLRSLMQTSKHGATLWFSGQSTAAAEAALANGTHVHHTEMDDGHPEASLHGGATVVPAALAVAESERAEPKDFLAAVAAGYASGIAFGRALKPGIVAHGLHPPAIAGTFAAAAAAIRAARGSMEETAAALSLSSCLVPIAPFENFPRGASVKDLYAGWPAYLGVSAAALARSGFTGPLDVLSADEDGLGTFLLHRSAGSDIVFDAGSILGVEVKPFAACRSVHPALTPPQQLLPLEPLDVESIEVETYPFARELSADGDLSTPIGARCSIPYCVGVLLCDKAVTPRSFSTERLGDPERQRVSARVVVEARQDVRPRGARVRVRTRGGEVRFAGCERPLSVSNVREAFRERMGDRSRRIADAVDALPEAESLDELTLSLRSVH